MPRLKPWPTWKQRRPVFADPQERTDPGCMRFTAVLAIGYLDARANELSRMGRVCLARTNLPAAKRTCLRRNEFA